MTITTSPEPRFRCRVARTARALVDGAGERHALGCADCQAFFLTAETLDQELRRDASALRAAVAEPSSELAQNILRAIREEAVVSRPVRFRKPVWAMSAIAVAAMVAVIVVQWPMTPSRPMVATADDTEAIVQALENLSVKLTDTVIPQTGEILANNSLQKELGSVYADARSALDFLVLNFLPAAPRSESEPTGTI